LNSKYLFKGNILLVDDEEDIRETLDMLLTKLGFKVTLASNATEACELIKKKKNFKFVLVDFQMPHFNGTEFIKVAKDILKTTTKYIIITGDTCNSTDFTVADSVLYKPFTKNNLIDTLAKYL
jgi:CheY-like chemotaxis protein